VGNPRPGDPGPDRDAGDVDRLDQALQELRHATYGFYGAQLRAGLLRELGWTLAPVHYRLLRVVEATEPLRPTIGDVAETLLTDKARASRLVDQAATAGLVRRTTGRLDRRRREVELTDHGRSYMADARRLRRERLRQVVSGWPEADVAALASLLGRFNDALQADAPEMVVERPPRFD
jgi:DNA-binding MarR family transcriptional regulator